ncbi:MAG: pilus assembly protein PilM [Patescibacteria group bacterium]
MALFFGKKESYLGIDLGSTSIKLVELRSEHGVPTLVTYGYAERAMGDVVRGDPEKVQKRAVELLIKLHKESGAESYRAVTALPNFAVFSSVITLPAMSKKELAQAITWEAKKFVPLPLEEVILDWKIIEEVKLQKTVEVKKPVPASKSPTQEEIRSFGENLMTEKKSEDLTTEPKIQKGSPVIAADKKTYRILLTAASRNLIKRYVEIFRLANIQLLALETEAFALTRALVGGDTAVTMIIDSSAVTTDIIIIEKGVPVLNRSIDVGGVTLTRSIANILNIDFKRSEQFKRDIGLSGTSKIPTIIEQALKPVVEEIEYFLNLYQTQSGQVVEKVILSGGSAYLPNLADYFSNLLKIKVIIGDPWARIAYPAELKPVLEEIAPRFAVAIGSALREVE